MMRKRVILCLLILLAAALLSGCHRKRLDEGVLIESFLYETFGTERDSETMFSIVREEEGFIVTQSSGGGQFVRTAHVVQKIMVQATDILRAHDVLSWDGYAKSNSHVLDGTAFTLHIVFGDGTEISAKGTNSHPKGMPDAIREIQSLFDRFLCEPDQ